MTRADRGLRAPARIEVHIGELIIGDLGTAEPDALVAALTTELRSALARELAWCTGPGEAARAARLSAARVRATMALPPAGRTPGAAAPTGGPADRVGTAIGATLARAVAGRLDPALPRGAQR